VKAQKKAALGLKRKKAQEMELARKESKRNCGRKRMFWCQHPSCTRLYVSESNLKAHMDRGDHTGGIRHLRKGKRILDCTNVSQKDMMKTLITKDGGFAESYNPTQLKSAGGGAVELHPMRAITLATGKAYKPTGEGLLGLAVKPKRGKGQPLSKGQLQFVSWCYQLGVKDKNQKMSGDRAAEVMALVGTQAGEARYTSMSGVNAYMKANADDKPTFRVWELLDSWRIKPWFSQQKAAFNTKYKNQLAAAETEASRDAVEVDLDDEIDDDIEE
jgi:hypothetical protein